MPGQMPTGAGCTGKVEGSPRRNLHRRKKALAWRAFFDWLTGDTASTWKADQCVCAYQLRKMIAGLLALSTLVVQLR